MFYAVAAKGAGENMSFKYNYYSGLGNYFKDPTSQDLNISANGLSLIRGSIIVGLAPYAHRLHDQELLEWKIKTMLTFIDPTKYKVKYIDSLEQSEKVAVAYFIGMVCAQIHMQSIYKIRHMQHLTNRGIESVSTQKK